MSQDQGASAKADRAATPSEPSQSSVVSGKAGIPCAGIPLHRVIEQVSAEVVRATIKFPTWPTDIIHAGNIVAEEAGELAKAILQVVYEPHKSSLADVREEAEQTAAMAIRFLMSIGRYAATAGDQHRQIDPRWRCGACGASQTSSTSHCAPPFGVALHRFDGTHPADRAVSA